MKPRDERNIMKSLTKLFIHGIAFTLLLIANASASDADTPAPAFEQNGAAVHCCANCDHTLATADSLMMPNVTVLPGAEKPKSRHTFTAFGFVIHGGRSDQRSEWLARDAATLSEAQASRSLSRMDAERQPQGLRLFS